MHVPTAPHHEVRGVRELPGAVVEVFLVEKKRVSLVRPRS
jgi:hypothetical protein